MIKAEKTAMVVGACCFMATDYDARRHEAQRTGPYGFNAAWMSALSDVLLGC